MRFRRATVDVSRQERILAYVTGAKTASVARINRIICRPLYSLTSNVSIKLLRCRFIPYFLRFNAKY